MPQPFIRYKKHVDTYLTSFLAAKQKDLFSVNKWSDDVFKKLCEFVIHGKTIRGSFLLFITEAYGKKANEDTLKLAAAVELIHCGLLIHDDIMDADRMRRGRLSIYAQYEEVGKQLRITKSLQFGQDVAICVGDLTLFLAMELIGSCKNQKMVQSVLQIISSEHASVCLAQIQDVEFGFSNRIPSKDEVLSLYTYKTARYTFSLPFLLGSILADVPKIDRANLEKLGQHLGIIFQLRDDALNLFGDPKTTGKSIGSDIREGKKTLALVHLFTHAGNADRQKLQTIIKMKTRKPTEISFVYQLLAKYQIQTYLKTEINNLTDTARHQLALLSISPVYKRYMIDVLEYIQTRAK